LESRGIDFAKPLALEILALNTGEAQQGKPIYDRGGLL
jgi:hypothetical protein